MTGPIGVAVDEGAAGGLPADISGKSEVHLLVLVDGSGVDGEVAVAVLADVRVHP